MRKNILTKLTLVITLLSIIACEKQEPEPEINKEWLEYLDYIPFPEKNVIWTNIYSSRTWWDNSTNYGTVSTNKYFFQGDTSINGKKYLKLYNDNIFKRIIYEDTTTTELVDTAILYAGAFRQSISKKKVYFIFKNTKDEKTLYDFSAKPGESVNIFTTSDIEGTVFCIDSTLINERYHKIYYIQVGNLLNAYTYIEGIGNINGLIYNQNGSLGTSYYNFISFEYNNQEYEINWVEANSCFE